MQRQDAARRRAPLLKDLVGLLHAERAGDAAQVGRLCGNEVRAAEPLQLDAVLQHPLEPVGRIQLRAVGASHVAVADERQEAVEGAAQAHTLVTASVHELQELHRELGVAQATGTQLDLTVGLARRDQRDHAFAHRLAFGDEGVVAGDVPDVAPHHVHEGVRESRVACHRARLEHRLELPVLGPLLVVGGVRRQGSHQRTVLAFGAKVGVELPDGAAGRVGRRDAAQDTDQA